MAEIKKMAEIKRVGGSRGLMKWSLVYFNGPK